MAMPQYESLRPGDLARSRALHWAVTRAIRFGSLIACCCLLMATSVLRVETTAGTIVLEITSSDGVAPVISVDAAHRVSVSTAHGDVSLEISGDKSNPSLRVADGRVEAVVQELTLTPGPNQRVQVRIEPLRIQTPLEPEQVQELQTAWARYTGEPVESENALGMQFQLIPPGRFMMGSPEAEVEALTADESNALWKQYYQSESPRHSVTISEPFLMGAHPVTRGQFRQFVEASGYQTDAQQDREGGYSLINWERSPDVTWRETPGVSQTDEHPVINVSWNDAVAFCRWLSQEESAEYELPTEAQWEYACRAGSQDRWSMGDDETQLNNHVWFVESRIRGTAVVGVKEPNPFGLFDMHGNVYEWCHDWYADNSYSTSSHLDPRGPDTGDYRVIRGGSFWALVRNVRSAHRNVLEPTGRTPFVGFRVTQKIDVK